MLTPLEVAQYRNVSNPDDPVLSAAVEAVNFYVDSLPSIDRDEWGQWAPTTQYAALILAVRWYNRRDSITAITGFGDSGAPQFITRYDADVARMLHIDGFGKPQVG